MANDFKNIDFESTKNSIINYLKNTDEFKDYNYTGSALNVLIDALAYTSTYMQMYSNFSLNESFLDTAQKRSSVVSHAKNIGYIPYQYNSARAKLKLIYRDIGKPKYDYIPEGTVVTANNGTNTYYFRTRESYKVEMDKNGIYYAYIDVIEGTKIKETWVQDAFYTTKYIISQPKIDTNTLDVIVYPTKYDTIGEKYNKLTDSSQIGPNEKTYFLQENFNGNIEITFGDNVMAKKLLPGNFITVEYYSSAGSDANGIVNFIFSGIPNDSSQLQLWSVETIEQSYGGGDKQSTEEIRKLAPLFYQRQNRNVIAQDYLVHLMSNFGSWIESVSVWGGEDNIPPQYGRVFIAVKPKDSIFLTSIQKNDIIELLKSRMIICITPEIVEAYPIYNDLSISVNYDINTSYKSEKEIKEMIQNSVEEYYKENVQKLNSSLIYSKLNTIINNIDDSISSSDIDIKFFVKFSPDSNIKKTYTFQFFNKLSKGSVKIGEWYLLGGAGYGSIKDDEKGNLHYYINDNLNQENVGNVDYDSGVITLNNFKFNVAIGSEIKCYSEPFSKNNYVERNALFLLNNMTILVNE